MQTEIDSSVTAKRIGARAGVTGGGLESHRLSESAHEALERQVIRSYDSILKPGLQACELAAATGATARKVRGLLPVSKSPVIASPRLVLRGDPAMLRRLRAAEMAAWKEPAPPRSPDFDGTLWVASPAFSRAETLVLAVLAVAAAIGVLLGFI